MEANRHPLYQYCMCLMEAARAASQDPENLSMEEDIKYLIDIAEASKDKPNELIIGQITAILSRRKFVAVFRPSDVEALLFLRDQLYWKGHAMLFRVAGNHPLYRLTFDTLRIHDFPVFSYGALLYPGDLDHENVNPGSLVPLGYVNGFVDEGNQKPDPNNPAYNSGFNQGQIIFNEIVANPLNWGNDPIGDNLASSGGKHRWHPGHMAGKFHMNCGSGSTQVWNDFMKGWNDAVNAAAAPDAAGNNAVGGDCGGGTLISKGVRLFHMDMITANTFHRDCKPFQAFPGNLFGKGDGFSYGCPFKSSSWQKMGLNPFYFV